MERFFLSLLTSTSMEVATMANLVARDLQSTTGQNIRMLEEASGMCVREASMSQLKEAVQQKEMVEVNDCVNYWVIERNYPTGGKKLTILTN